MKRKLLKESPDNIRYKGGFYSCDSNGQPFFISSKYYFGVKDEDNNLFHMDLEDVISRVVEALMDEDDGLVDEYREEYAWNVPDHLYMDLRSIFDYDSAHKLRLFKADDGEYILSMWGDKEEFLKIIKSKVLEEALQAISGLTKEEILYDNMAEQMIVSYSEFVGAPESTEEEKERQRKISYWMSVLHTATDNNKRIQARFELKKLGVNVTEGSWKDPKKYPKGMTKAEYRSLRYPQESFNDIVGDVIEEEIESIYELPSLSDKVSLSGVLDVIMTTVSE